MAKLVLRDYQKQIINELKHLSSSALYMGTGTGKTITSLELMTHNPTSNLLVVCPHSAKEQWKMAIQGRLMGFVIHEFKKSWTSTQINKEMLKVDSNKNNVIITNYEMLYRLPNLLKVVDNSWTIILDEIHRIKSYGTSRNPVKATRFALELGNKTQYKIGLSATPTQGDFGGYIEYYPQLKFLGYTDLSYNHFYNKHVVYKEISYGTPYPIRKIVGYKNVQEIDDILKIIAKRYVPVYGDFEPQQFKIEIDRCPNYARTIREKAYIKDGVKILLNKSGRTRVAKKTLTTGVILGHDMQGGTYIYKDNSLKLDWIEDFLKDTDEVVTILYTYNVELQSLRELMEKIGKKYIVINGAEDEKYKLVNSGGYDVVLGQFKAISEALDGLHLFCHIEIFFSMPESSLTYTQTIGRIDRIGQTKVPMYYFLIMKKTIDEKIMYNIEHKISFSEATLEKLDLIEEIEDGIQ